MKPSRLRTLLPALVVLAGALVVFGLAAYRRGSLGPGAPASDSASDSAGDAGVGAQPFFALRRASETGAAPGFHPFAVENGEPVFLSDDPVVSNLDVVASRAVAGPSGGAVVEIDWTPEARARLKQATLTPGKTFALVIDDHLEMLLTFDQPVDDATTRLDRGAGVTLEAAQGIRPPLRASSAQVRRSMFKKFVFWTGASDYLVGLATWGGAVGVAMAEPVKGQFVPLITLGTFLLMAAALLVWASRDLATRAPVVFWQGLVRLSAIAGVLYAVPHGLSETWEYALLGIDVPIGLTYVIGSMRVTGLSFGALLLCKT